MTPAQVYRKVNRLAPEDKEYLLRRGYTEELLRKEPIFSVVGECSVESVKFAVGAPTICFECRSMSGKLIGISTAMRSEKNYQFHQNPDLPFLPIIYGAREDFEILYQTGEMILAEGVFDRVAMKRFLPEKAVFARLSKGIGGQLTAFIQRYTRKLWLAFDQDEPGRKGSEGAKKKLQGMQISDLKYPAKDPALLLERLGPKKAGEILRREMELGDF